MSENLVPGLYRIVSLFEGNYAVGIKDPAEPGSSEPVRVSGRIQDWNLEREKETILLRIGGFPVTHVINQKVAVTSLPGPGQKWRATYREMQEAYTIAMDNKPETGWTVPSDAEDIASAEIEIRVIIATKSLPPRYLPTQLYRFERVCE